MADKKEEQCRLIVSYEMAQEDADRCLNSRENANDLLRRQPGFIDTELHRAVSANPDFGFMEVSCWESDDDFRSATQSPDFCDASGRLLPFPIDASAYEIVNT